MEELLVSIYSRKRLGLSALVLAAGLATSVLVPVAAGATPVVDPFNASAASVQYIQRAWSSVPEYSSAPALTTGSLTDPAGRAMPGATIIVLPVPKSPKAGQSLTPVARATTNSNGGYTIRLPYSERSLLQEPGTGGYLNLHIIAFYPDAMANWFMPINASTRTIPTAHLVLRQLPSKNAANAAASLAAAPQVPIPPGAASCSEVSNTEVPGVEMVVGYKSTLTASHIRYAQYTYTTSASQTTGVGVSLTAKNTGFSVDGTTTESSGFTASFKQITGASNNYMAVNSTWNDTEWHCQAGNLTWFYGWTTYLNGVGSTWSDPTPGAPQVAAGKCLLAGANTTVTYDTTSQSTWTAGVSISGDIGINLSSQDGWSGSSSLTYAFATSAPICGVSNYPNANNPSAGYLQVH
jgi:hypothetical protein